MKTPSRYDALDMFRLAAAMLVVSNHISPLENISLTADFVLTRVIARVSVPFFLTVTGYFLFTENASGSTGRLKSVMKRTSLLYGAGILIYLPLNIYNGAFKQITNPPLQFIEELLLGGTFYHLWYLPALLVSLPAVWFLWRRLGIRAAFAVGAALYIIGLGGDSYYSLVSHIPSLKSFYDALYGVSNDLIRLLRVPIFLALGGLLRSRKAIAGRGASSVGLSVSGVLLIAEAMWLHTMGFQRTDRMYILLLPSVYFLLSLLVHPSGRSRPLMLAKLDGKRLRQTSMLIYIIHPWLIVLVRGAAKLTGTSAYLVDNRLVLYILVCALAMAAAQALYWLRPLIKKPQPSAKGRAWVEISKDALHHNAEALQQLLPTGCRLMAVLKANAYGHGAAEVAKELRRCGISFFAVATLSEGIALRRAGIRGNILVLGYTQPSEARLLQRFRLMQTVVDAVYAGALSRTGITLDVHVKIDTGMHRLGVDSNNISSIEDILHCHTLTVRGMFTHLSRTDDLSETSVEFTLEQVRRFTDTVRTLTSKGYQVGTLHIQESYGILNYPEIRGDYARAGIALYGVLSKNDGTVLSPALTPALSLRARIAVIKWIGKGETVGYGSAYIAQEPIRIAAVTIGYADGIPRDFASRSCYILLGGQRAPVVGLVCMDLLLVDVTCIENVNPGDIVTLIGRDGGEVIRCEDVAERCGTITNDLLSRLGARLPRIYI